jgi:hypothetical protein
VDETQEPQPDSHPYAECAGCGGELYLRDTVIAWWPIHPRWVPGISHMAFIHVGCAAPLRSFEMKGPQTLAQALSAG